MAKDTQTDSTGVENAQAEMDKSKTAPKAKRKVKIRLLCDVLTPKGKLEEGDEMELTPEELEKFAESFYEKV